ncbi:WcaI family glycosyltransferase [Devosia sp. CAU 1758]
MKILVLGLNYAPEKVGIAVYTSGMAEYLAEAGHDMRVVAAKPYYPAWQVLTEHSAWGWSSTIENDVRVIRVPHYIPRDPTGAKRLLHHFSFALSSFLPALWAGLTWRPDVVFTVAPSLIAAPVGRLAALLGGARSWLHIQDFEVEAAFATGLLKSDSFFAGLALGFETGIFSKFQTISTISPQMCRKLIEKGIPEDRIVEFRNWADIEAIRPSVTPSSFRSEWGVTTPNVALYSGNIANKQGIEIVVDAARLLKDRKDLTFIVCGEGPNRSGLERRAEGLSNIQFHNLQPKEKLHELMGLSTIHLLPQTAGAADLVLPSKLTNMLASGRPVVATAALETGLAKEVEGCGIITPPGVPRDLAAAIERLIDDPKLYAQCAGAARQRAEARWAKDVVLNSFHKQLHSASLSDGSNQEPTAETESKS